MALLARILKPTLAKPRRKIVPVADEFVLVAPGALAAPAALTRASGALALNQDGMTWDAYGANVARFSGSARQLWIEGQRTNSNFNPLHEGVAVGVLGSGGSLPNGTLGWSSGGLTFTVVAVGVASGLNYFDLRMSGTTSSTFVQMPWDSTTTATAASGEIWTSSIYVAMIAGSTANIGSINNRVIYTGANALSFNMASTLNSTLKRYATTLQATSGATAVTHGFSMGFAAGVAVDITLRFSFPQLELGGYASTPIMPPVGVPGASTRAADLVSALLASLGIAPNGACTLLWSGTIPQSAAGAAQTILRVDDGSGNNLFSAQNAAAGNVIQLTRTTGGAATAANLASMTPGTLFRLGLTADGAGRVAGSMNGAAAVALTGAPATGLTALRLGNGSGGTSSMFGGTSRLIAIPGALSDTDLAARVAALAA